MVEESEQIYLEDSIAHYLSITVTPILLVLGTLGNMLSLRVFYPKATKFKQQSSYCFLCILAVVDTISLLMSSLSGFLMEGFDIDLVLYCHCGYFLFVNFLFTDMAIYTIICMTVDRAISLFLPFKAKVYCTRKRAIMSSMFVFCVLILINGVITVAVGPVQIEQNTNTSEILFTCQPLSGYNTFINYTWPWIDLTVLSFFPWSVLLILNIAIISRMRRQNKRIHVLGQQSENRNAVQKRTDVLLLSICILFFLSTAPLAILHIVEPYWSREQDLHQKAIHTLVTVIAKQLLILNNCLNFALYCVSGREFRKDLRRIFFKGENSESDNLTALA